MFPYVSLFFPSFSKDFLISSIGIRVNLGQPLFVVIFPYVSYDVFLCYLIIFLISRYCSLSFLGFPKIFYMHSCELGAALVGHVLLRAVHVRVPGRSQILRRGHEDTLGGLFGSFKGL